MQLRMAHIRTSALVIAIAVCARAAAAQTERAVSPPVPNPASSEDLTRASAAYEYDYIGDASPWRALVLDVARRFDAGTFIARANLAERFGVKGHQLEAEAYPHLTKHAYLYAAVAVSPSRAVFVPLRVALEPYYNFTSGWEGSAGIRYFHTPGPKVLTVTGTIAKYFGNYWISGRPSVSTAVGTRSYTAAIVGRKYFSGRYDYLSIAASRSIGADIESSDPARFLRPARFRSYEVHADWKRPFGNLPFRTTLGASYEHEQVAPLRFRNHRRFTLGLEWFER